MKTFKDLIKEFKKFGDNHTQINDYTYGNYQYNDDSLYVLLNIKPITSITDGSITSFVFEISFFDLLEQDFSNYIDIINSNNLIMNDFRIYFYDFIDPDYSIESKSNKTDNNLVQTTATISFNLDSLYCSTAFCDSSFQTVKWGGISGDINNQSDLMNYFNNFELLYSNKIDGSGLYMETVYNLELLTNVNYYTNQAKTLKIFSKVLFYDVDNQVIKVETTGELIDKKLVVEIEYDNYYIKNIKKEII